jgi:hypothetical protein
MQAGGVFAAIRDDEEVFRAVAVDREFGTSLWPGDVDLDPDVLRGDRHPASDRHLGTYLDESFSRPAQAAARIARRPFARGAALHMPLEGRSSIICVRH